MRACRCAVAATLEARAAIHLNFAAHLEPWVPETFFQGEKLKYGCVGGLYETESTSGLHAADWVSNQVEQVANVVLSVQQLLILRRQLVICCSCAATRALGVTSLFALSAYRFERIPLGRRRLAAAMRDGVAPASQREHPSRPCQSPDRYRVNILGDRVEGSSEA